MAQSIDRREFLKLAGLGGAVFASGLAGGARFVNAADGDFYFVQLSDTHWGFNGPAVNPDWTDVWTSPSASSTSIQNFSRSGNRRGPRIESVPRDSWISNV